MSAYKASPPAVLREESNGVRRVGGRKHLRFPRDVPHTKPGEDQKPEQRDGPENLAHPGGSVMLREEESDQNRDRDRDDIGLEQGSRHLQSFHRAQDRDGRGDRAIAVEERRAEETEHHQARPAAALAYTHRCAQRGER
jgi:hypothetical protein